MKRILFIFFLFFSLPLLTAEDVLAESVFDVTFRKPGETDFYFTSELSDVSARTAVLFDSIQPGSDARSTSGNFGFKWQIYHNGNVTIDLIFSAVGNTEEANGYMLYHTTENIGLNYNIKFNEASVLDPDYGLKEIENVQHVQLTESERTIRLFDGNCSDIKGTIGHAKFDLSMDAPEDGFLTGQYKGEIEAIITMD